MLQEGCYWRPAAAASADTQAPATGEPAGSLASDDLDLLSSGGQPSLLPSPDSTHSVHNFHDQPVSGSSQEEEESSPTQASEPAALSAGTVTSPVGEDETPVHEISSCDSPKPVNEGAEDREEEAATDDSVVEQQEEHEIASVWEVNDSSSVSSQGHYEPVDGVRSQSAKSLPSVASPCSQANEQLDAPPAAATGAASAVTEPANITACPSGLPRHRDTIQDNNNMAEGDCPSSCPPAEQAEAGAPGAQALKGMRRRWQQASQARTGAPSDRGERRETDTSQQQLERERTATPLRLVEGPYRPRPPNTVRLSPRRSNRWRCHSALQRVSKAHLHTAQRTQVNRACSAGILAESAWQKPPSPWALKKIPTHRKGIPQKRAQTCKSALLRLPLARKGTMLGSRRPTLRYNPSRERCKSCTAFKSTRCQQRKQRVSRVHRCRPSRQPQKLHKLHKMHKLVKTRKRARPFSESRS